MMTNAEFAAGADETRGRAKAVYASPHAKGIRSGLASMLLCCRPYHRPGRRLWGASEPAEQPADPAEQFGNPKLRDVFDERLYRAGADAARWLLNK